MSKGWSWGNVYRNIHWDDFIAGFTLAFLIGDALFMWYLFHKVAILGGK